MDILRAYSDAAHSALSTAPAMMMLLAPIAAVALACAVYRVTPLVASAARAASRAILDHGRLVRAGQEARIAIRGETRGPSPADSRAEHARSALDHAIAALPIPSLPRRGRLLEIAQIVVWVVGTVVAIGAALYLHQVTMSIVASLGAAVSLPEGARRALESSTDRAERAGRSVCRAAEGRDVDARLRHTGDAWVVDLVVDTEIVETLSVADGGVDRVRARELARDLVDTT